MSSLYLVGFMGCGKTTAGPIAAERLQRPFVDLDDHIERTVGRAIADIFADEGEAAFRRAERQALGDVAAGPQAVVATGGGLFADEGNRRLIRATGGTSVFLDVPWAVLEGRIGSPDGSRPLWPSTDAARDLFARRIHAYQSADITIELTGDESPQAVAERIVCATLEFACGT